MISKVARSLKDMIEELYIVTVFLRYTELRGIQCSLSSYWSSAHLHLQYSVASYPGPPFNFAHGGPGLRKYVTLDKRGYMSMETPPFTMASFQSAHGQVAVWCKYSSSETDDRIAS